MVRNKLEDHDKDFRKLIRYHPNLAIFQDRHIVKIDNQCYLMPNDIIIITHRPSEDVSSVIAKKYTELLKNINGFFVTFTLQPNDKGIEEYHKEHMENNDSNAYKVKKNGIEYSIMTRQQEDWDIIYAFRIDSGLTVVSINLVFMENSTSVTQRSDAAIAILEGIKPTSCRN